VRGETVYILIVDDDPAMRRLLRTGLELEGFSCLEAASIGQARALLRERLRAIVLDRELPDGDGVSLIDEIAATLPDCQVIVHSNLGGPADVLLAPKGDVNAILDLLDLPVPVQNPGPSADLLESVAGEVRTRAEELWEEWRLLCQWDPELPPDTRPAVGATLIQSMSEALERPQPLGWGLDPALEPAAEALALNSPSLDVAMSQLVCLREALERRVVAELPAEERAVANHRLNMLVLRLMVVVARASVAELEAQAFRDPLTGLMNRRAFDLDLDRERARARRHRRPVSVVVVDVDHLKRVNDAMGHREGDKLLRALAAALESTLRREDGAYRIGGDEFAILLPDTLLPGPQPLIERLEAAGAPQCSVGVATFPMDDLETLVELADRRLYEGRAARERKNAG